MGWKNEDTKTLPLPPKNEVGALAVGRSGPARLYAVESEGDESDGSTSATEGTRLPCEASENKLDRESDDEE